MKQEFFGLSFCRDGKKELSGKIECFSRPGRTIPFRSLTEAILAIDEELTASEADGSPYPPPAPVRAGERPIKNDCCVRILCRENATWQGELIRVRGGRVYFKSVLELMHLLSDEIPAKNRKTG